MGLTAMALGMTGAGGLLSAKGQLDAGRAANERGKFQEKTLQNNAQFREFQADDAIERGKVSVQRNQRSFAQLMGRQRAVLAGNGILVDDGSAADLVADSAFVGREEQRDIERNAEREAMALRMDAANLNAEAENARLAGKNAKKASKLKAVGSLLGAGGRVTSIASQGSFPRGPGTVPRTPRTSWNPST